MKRASPWIALVVLCAWGVAGCGGSSHHTPPPVIPTNNFVFYAAGTDSTGSTYSIVGVVQITADGNNTIVSGEQDFNDGDGLTSPQTPAPGGDTILAAGSSLTFNPDGSGNAVLVLATNNAKMGNAGTETFALSFANANHALIAQFDGSATSLGSYDLQTLPTAALASTSFSLTTSGVDSTGAPIVRGGVLALDASGTVMSSIDINDGGDVSFANSATVGTSVPASDTFGRGTVTGSIDGTTAVVNYYIVSSEVLRLIDVNTTDTAVGSAYGQGTAAGSFSPSSIGTSVFSISGVDDLVLYSGAGQFFTTTVDDGAKPTSNARAVHPDGGLPACTGTECSFSGVADMNESLLDGGPIVVEQGFNGTYVLETNGHGSFLFVDPPTDDVAVFGIYAVDPTLNILDPNDSIEGLTGGALIAELDTNLVGTGLLIPQTVPAPAVAAIAPDVIFGAQGDAAVDGNVEEFELLGALATDSGDVSGEGFIDDPTGILTGAAIIDPNSTFDATFTDDGENIGRSTTGTGGFVATDSSETAVGFTVTAYAANGNQLFWVETDKDSTFAGSIQASTFTVPDAKKAQAKPKNNK